MTVESEIVARLEVDGAVTALVGSGDDARIYPVLLPQDPTYPAVTYQRVSGARLHNLAGTAGFAMPRLSINCWSRTYGEAKSLAAAIRASLDGFDGTLATIRATIKIVNEIDLPEQEPKPDVYRILQDYTVNHRET